MHCFREGEKGGRKEKHEGNWNVGEDEGEMEVRKGRREGGEEGRICTEAGKEEDEQEGRDEGS